MTGSIFTRHASMPQVQSTTTTIAVKTLPLNITFFHSFFAINITSRLFCQMYRQTHTEENSSSLFVYVVNKK